MECSRCHLVKPITEFHKDKRVKSGYTHWCEDCHREYHKTYYGVNKGKFIQRASGDYYNNKEERLATIRLWQLHHGDKRKIYTQRYRDAHREQCSIAIRRWKRNHKVNACIYSHNRRARFRGTITEKEWEDILLFYDYTCLCCGRHDVKLTMDHVVPVSLGGSNLVGNIQPLCQSCNSKKALRTTDFRIAQFTAGVDMSEYQE